MLASAARAARVTALKPKSIARALATVSDAHGIKIAAVDRGEATTSLSVIAKAGSRYETTPGVAHVLKNFAFKTTGHKSHLRTVREAELYGGVLSSSLSREYMTFTAEFLRGDEELFAEILTSILNAAMYLPHELTETVSPVVAAEAHEVSSSPAALALELAHAVAFRSGLGASLYASPHTAINLHDVKEYARTVFAKGNVAVVGSGISDAALAKLFAAELRDGAAASSPATKYYGGEQRVQGSSHAPHALFIGYGTAGAATPELAVLAALLSPTPSVKWSAGTSAFAKALPPNTHAESVLLSYSDAALFGVLVQGATVEAVAGAARAAVAAIKAASAGPAAEELKAAVAKAKFKAAQAADGRSAVLETLGPELLGGPKVSTESALSAIDKVSASAFTKAAGALLKAKPTVVAVGDTYTLPYADQLGL